MKKREPSNENFWHHSHRIFWMMHMSCAKEINIEKKKKYTRTNYIDEKEKISNYSSEDVMAFKLS